MNLPNGYLLQNGKYKLSHVVGQGGFGITYKGVWNTELKGALGTIKTDVPICVKEYFFKDYCYRDTNSQFVLVHSETGRNLFNKFKEKLIKEAKILSDVHHPYIVNVLEVFEENNTAYIVMEYISGTSLKAQMDKNGILPETLVLKYVRQIGEALQFVHEKSILHLDIKPSNILVDKDNNARLIDFGVSKRYDIEEQETSTTMLTLSKGFASIEQYDNEGTQVFSPCPDIYSLGATMYNLLTGKIPTESILRATRPLQRPSEINPSITVKTETAILKAMEIIPADRFQSVSEMLGALDLPAIDVLPLKSDTYQPADLYNNDDTTVLYSANLSSGHPVDDEQTIVSNAEPLPTPSKEKKKKKRILFSFFFTIFALTGGSTAVWYVYNSKPSTELASSVNLPSEEKNETHLEVTNDEHVDTDLEPLKEKVTESVAQSVPSVNKQPEEKQEKVAPLREKEKQPAGVVEEKAESVKQLSKTEIDASYSKLVASGKTKMDAADYFGAKTDFAKAKDIKLTEEVVRLQIACDAKQEEKELSDRKAKYQEMMVFGKYKIVRNKSTGKYGAIDLNAIERIPCKYLSVGKSDNGRAFERIDNLFDIYNSDGVLVSEGLTYY